MKRFYRFILSTVLVVSLLLGIITASPIYAASQVSFGGYYDALNNAATEYNLVQGSYTWSATENYRKQGISAPGTITNLYVELSVDPGTSPDAYTFTLMLNGAATALTCSIVADSTSGNDTAHSVSVAAGDVVSLRCEAISTPSAAPYAQWSMMFTGSVASQSNIMSSVDGDNTQIVYWPASGGAGIGWTVELQSSQLVAAAGKIKNLYVVLDTDPGTDPDAFRFTLRLNGASSALTCTITANATTGNDTAHEVTVAAGDRICIMVEPLNTPSVYCSAWVGMTFEANIDGESLILAGSPYYLSASTTEYMCPIPYVNVDWNATEAQAQQLGQVCVLKNLYVLLDGTPYNNSHSADLYTITVRVNSASPANGLVAVVTSDATTANDTTHTITLAAGDNVSVQNVPTSTPTAREPKWGMVCYIAPTYSLTNSPNSKAFGSVAASSTYYAKGLAPSNPVVDGDCTFTVTNDGGSAEKISIKAANFTGGVGWTLTSGAPGENTVRITTYKTGDDPAAGVVLTTSDQTLIASLAAAAHTHWDFKFETGTFTDGIEKTGVITLTGIIP